ncbi:unnamed protein product [Phytophthora lilii]|uniref:Unnamed protein product n=1 Tax=Phytophthora lilii TaxID=2077276 RepID=A0A9W6YL86_9STRA|nr:unnamed protein product [Phytophthora lilii]
MSLPDAAEARRISAQLATLEQQRARGCLPHEDTPLRLYRVRTGGFVRVLDQHPEPISPGMVRSELLCVVLFPLLIGRFVLVQLEAIDAFIRKNGAEEETKPPARAEETRQDARLGGDREEQREMEHEKRAEVAANEASADEIVGEVPPSADVEEDVEKTQPSSSAAVEITPPWEGATAKTPRELIAQNKRASDWLGQRSVQVKVEQATTLQVQQDATTTETPDESLEPVDHPTLYEQWPPQLEERRKMWCVPRASGRRSVSANGSAAKHQPVVYWMHNTLRVMQGNYGLEAAILLSRRLGAPLVVVCFMPSSIIYPVCHSATASDAYARYSFVELYQQFSHAGVPFFGITAKEDGIPMASNEQPSIALKPNPLYEVLDAFEPLSVVTDAMFDSSSRSDIVRLARYLELNRLSCSWSLLSMDSTTCSPVYKLSMKLQSTFEHGAAFASEEQFGAEYASFAQPRNDTYVFSPLPRVEAQDPAVNQLQDERLSAVLHRLHLEEVNWQVVKAENAQASPQMRRYSEGEGLQKLSQLLSSSDSQPAIQAELRGGGVLSLLPFVRHGTLFAGYVLRRITEAIASCPVPTTPEERKALARRKVSGDELLELSLRLCYTELPH